MSEEKNLQDQLNDNTVMFTERKRLLFLGLPWTFTKYTISPGFITVDQGFFNTIEDVKLTTSFGERLFGLSTVTCYTGDVTNPELKLIHIRHAKEIKAYLLKTSEEARLTRRTLSTMDIGAHNHDIDGDGVSDCID